MMVVRVTCTPKNAVINGMCNGSSSDIEMEDAPPAKRSRKSLDRSQDRSSPLVVDDSPVSPPDDAEVRVFGADLVIYDRHRRCLLTDGDYELVLKDMGQPESPKKQATWETVCDGKAVTPFEVFSRCATLKFKLSWTKGEKHAAGRSQDEYLQNNQIVKQIPGADLATKADRLRSREPMTPSKRKRIFYQFLYNNNTRQQTEARDDLHCPWCSINCSQLYSLLKHLRVCHARFNFKYLNVSLGFQEHPKGARIDVAINENYDGSYVGNPQDLHSHIGYAFSRNGPVRRTPVTHVITYKPEEPQYDLAEFLEPESDSHASRQLVQGHNRLYFHTNTCQAVRPCEIDDDSEDENDPEWLRQKTIQMIDEFTDVNEGEKEVMKMWNLHVMRFNYIGDCQMPKACRSFVEEFGERIISQGLCKNFLLHLTNLSDFGLLTPSEVYKSALALVRLQATIASQPIASRARSFEPVDLSLIRVLPPDFDGSSMMERLATSL